MTVLNTTAVTEDIAPSPPPPSCTPHLLGHCIPVAPINSRVGICL